MGPAGTHPANKTRVKANDTLSAKERRQLTREQNCGQPEHFPKEEPVVYRRGSSEVFLLERLRDTVHRFAANSQGKRSEKSALEEAEGIGSARRKALLRRVVNLNIIRETSPRTFLPHLVGWTEKNRGKSPASPGVPPKRRELALRATLRQHDRVSIYEGRESSVCSCSCGVCFRLRL